jgi:hypothetical protein
MREFKSAAEQRDSVAVYTESHKGHICQRPFANQLSIINAQFSHPTKNRSQPNIAVNNTINYIYLETFILSSARGRQRLAIKGPELGGLRIQMEVFRLRPIFGGGVSIKH